MELTLPNVSNFKHLMWKRRRNGYKLRQCLPTTVLMRLTRKSSLRGPVPNPGAPREISGPGAKISFGPFGQWCPKITWWAKKGQSVRKCSNFGPKSNNEQKKGHSFRRCLNFGSTSSDEQNKVIAFADVRTSARNQKKTSSRSQAVVWADELCILNLTILNPEPLCVPGPPDSDPFYPPTRRAWPNPSQSGTGPPPGVCRPLN